MKFGYVMRDGEPVHVIHGNFTVTYDKSGGRHEFPVKFIEAESWKDAVSKIKGVGSSDVLQNMAAMRDALRFTINQIDKNPDRLSAGQLLCIIGDKAEAALAWDPRNCDMFGGDAKMLHTAWFDWTGSPRGHNDDGTVKLTFGEWLLVKADRNGGAE